ncbi:MAG: hypothetical protein NTU53_19625 [Planctomycetota bacterium]|nr:hypothetical protein [Planctomycetota bacterium]
MDFTADVYLTAAQEHVTAARELYDSRRYTLAHYVAGLAVECIFRAYRYRIDPVFDERHDLHLLAKSARFYDIFPERHVEKISAALGVVVTQWLNNHRYRSEAALRSFLADRKLYVGIKGDFVKENSRRIVNAALDLVSLGVIRWKN